MTSRVSTLLRTSLTNLIRQRRGDSLLRTLPLCRSSSAFSSYSNDLPWDDSYSNGQISSSVSRPVFHHLRESTDPDRHLDQEKKQLFSYSVVAGVLTSGAVAAKSIVQNAGTSLLPYLVDPIDKVIEISLEQIPEGENIVIQYRGRPVFIRHRTPEQIQKARDDDNAPLKDPATDESRTKRPEWLVVKGICTHLGCTPIANAGDYQGYFCPCHGSHYDLSARIRRGPAPLNLPVPKYMFKGDNVLLIGQDENTPVEAD